MKKDFQDFKSVFSDFNFQSSSKKLLFSFLRFKYGLDLENDKVELKTERYLDSPHDFRHNARYLRWDDFLVEMTNCRTGKKFVQNQTSQ